MAARAASSAPGKETARQVMDKALANPELKNMNVDISWDEVAKYVVASPRRSRRPRI